MAVDWYVEGIEFGNCNCDYGCPCQFEAKPTHGRCHGFEVVRIDRGHFGEVRLDGLRAALVYAWPGPIYEGNGEMQVIVDQRADQRQRQALVTILQGGETEPGKTHWWVFREMCSRVHDPVFEAIELDVDLEARTAHVVIPGLLESTGRPIRSPVTREEHRVRINIPDGIEFETAEIASASTTCNGPVRLDLRDSYGQFNVLRHSRSGIVR